MSVAVPYPWHQEALSRWLAMASPHHAWLLCGPRGHGVDELAHAMAAAWLCDAPTGGVACGICESCRWLPTGAHPDFHVLAPEEQEEGSEVLKREEIKIDAIRAFAQWAVASAHRARKAAVISPADALNPNAANALLKLLEEPPPSVRFFLATTDPRRLPPTIASRCVRVNAPPASLASAKTWLEAQNIPTAQLELLLAQSGGAPLLALTASEQSVQSARGAFLDALASPQSLSALLLGDVLEGFKREERRAALQLRLQWLVAWVHDILLASADSNARFNPDYNTSIAAIANSFPKPAGFRYYANLIGRLQYIQHPLSHRLVLEDVLIEYKRLAMVGA